MACACSSWTAGGSDASSAPANARPLTSARTFLLDLRLKILIRVDKGSSIETCEIAGQRHSPERLVPLLHIVDEVHVIRSPQDHHLLRLRRPPEDVMHTVQLTRRILIGHQVERRNLADPTEGELDGKYPRPGPR